MDWDRFCAENRNKLLREELFNFYFLVQTTRVSGVA